MTAIPFTKMHGLGNDFVVLDARRGPLRIGARQARAIADRHTGIGCDQVIVIEPPANGLADAFMRIRNADGGEVAACGNGTRCVAAMIMKEKNSTHAVIETAAGVLDAQAKADGLIAVDMGPAATDWRDIPLAGPADTLHLDIAAGPLSDPVAVNMGNPHAVFFVDDAEAVPLDSLGPQIERHEMFPRATNVEVAQVLSGSEIRLRVWERGVGITLACGSGACAALVAASRRGLTGRAADVVVDGGRLGIEWLDDGHVRLTGPVAVSFTGTLGQSMLE
ncbi:MAG: diaminopimelate epimerase [Proteobacteria bacterium]|nr:diaminopimelate epimerase [Pseudomonadota bacterium]